MEAYSLDLRQRICAACDEGIQTRGEVAEQFGVSRWLVHKLLRQRRRCGHLAARPRGFGPPPIIGPQQQLWLRKRLESKPDATLEELRRQLSEAGGPAVSVPTLCRVIQGLGLKLKKRRCTPRSGTRHGCGPCVGTGKSEWRGWLRRSWFLWTKAASTPP